MKNASQFTRWHKLLWVGSFVMLGLLAGMATPAFSKVAEKISSSLVPVEPYTTTVRLLGAVIWGFVGVGLPFCVAILLAAYSMLRIAGMRITFPLRRIAASTCILLFAYPTGVFLCLGSSSAIESIETTFWNGMDPFGSTASLFQRQLANTAGFLFLLFAIMMVVLLCARGVAMTTGHLPRHALPVALGVASLFMLLAPMPIAIHDALHPRVYSVQISPPESYGLFELAISFLLPYVWWATSAVLAGLVGYWFLAGLQSRGETVTQQD